MMNSPTDILLKHIRKYYRSKNKALNYGDILPVSTVNNIIKEVVENEKIASATRATNFNNWVNKERHAALVAGAPDFKGIPDSWYDAAHWGDENGHISNTYLKSEVNGALCLACFRPVRLIPPHITEEELIKIINE